MVSLPQLSLSTINVSNKFDLTCQGMGSLMDIAKVAKLTKTGDSR